MLKHNEASLRLTSSVRLDVFPSGLRDKLARRVDSGILICMMILASALPFTAVTTLWQIGLWAGVILWLIHMMLTGKRRLVRTPLDLPLALFVVFSFISLITAVDRSYSFSKIISDLVAQILIFYLAANNLRTLARARWVLSALLFGTLVMDLYGVTHFWSSGGSILNPVLRENSLHYTVTELGTFLLQTAPFLTAGLFVYKSRWARVAILAFLIVHLLLAYMTLARMVIMVLLLEIAIAMVLAGKPWKIVAPAALAVLVLVAVVFPRPILVTNPDPAYHIKFGNKIALDGLKSDRFVIWERAWRYVKRHPFTGIGYGRESYGRAFPEIPEINPLFVHSHNSYLQMALSTGIQGLAAFLAMFYIVFTRLWKGMKIGSIKQMGLPA